MEETDLLQQIEKLNDKLNRTRQRMAGLRERSKLLEMQYHDAKEREQNTNGLVGELLERQRELNVMLNRANIMLNRSQEAMALSSMELNEMAKALPVPKKAEWADRVARVNELFKQTGVQDAELGALQSENPSTSFGREDMKKQSKDAFGRQQSIWEFSQKREPPKVEAEIVEEEEASEPAIHIIDHSPEQDHDSQEEILSEDEPSDDAVAEPSQRKSWWQRLAL